MSDTLKEKDSLAGASEEWKKKYEDNDKQWREKYKARFFTPTDTGASDPSNDVDDLEEPTEPPKQLEYDDLFKAKGE